MKIAVLGGGNGSFAAAGDFALQAMTSVVGGAMGPSGQHRAAGSRVLVGHHPPRRAMALVTPTSPKPWRYRVDRVPCPAFAQPDVARLIAPHLQTAKWCSAAGHLQLYDFAKAMHDAGNRSDAISPGHCLG